MILFAAGELNPAAFADDVRRATRDLAEVLAAATATRSAAVETTHFLMAVARLPGGVTQQGLGRRGLTVEQWQKGLASCAGAAPGPVRLTQLTETVLDQGARLMLNDARTRCEQGGLEQITEVVLLRCALGRATQPVRQLCADADIDLEDWCRELDDVIAPPPPVKVFAEDGSQKVLTESFSPSGRRVLRLLQSETQALGYDRADPRHLLLALLACDGGATHYGLFQQGRLPRTAQEAVALSLRGRARRTPSRVPLDREHMQPTLQHIVEGAGRLAGRAGRVAEAHLLGSFLAMESTARGLLADQGVDLAALRRAAEEHDVAADAGDEAEAALADIRTVRERLQQRLVGQDRAIDQILPYVEFMRFGMKTPGHPVGVFLFCGQSGSGKTEMAKELARAVYGSEENLIFLEMGQFNSKESMNIFVGAPPGYIGYGEGKLTNGLRDRPRAVVLFDEVEKADARVLDALLRFLDEGRIDDPAGPVRDGTECIVILTSNVASDELDELWERFGDRPDARAEIRRALREKFRRHNFRVEFLNRVDEVILFNTLKKEDYVNIARRHVEAFRKTLGDDFQIELSAGDDVAELIGEYCARLNEGARAVSRVARSTVLLPVCRHVLGSTSVPPVRLRVRLRRGGDPDAEPTSIVEQL